MITHYCQVSKWKTFVLFDVLVIVSGLLFLLLWRFLRWASKKIFNRTQFYSEDPPADVEFSDFNVYRDPLRTIEENKCFHFLHTWSRSFISLQTMTGKIMLVVSCVCTSVSAAIYVHDATVYSFVTELCHINYLISTLFLVDLICYSFFLFHFVISFLAAEDKITFWLGIYSLVDLMTIPMYVIEIYLDRRWMGFRCLRVICLIKFPDFLQHINVLKSPTKYRLIQLTAIFLCVWVVGAGMTQLLENSVLPLSVINGNNMSAPTLGDWMYFTIVTMSTVGYGDISPQSCLGRLWVSIFILLSFGIFASFIPEVAEILTSGSKYNDSYIIKDDYRHIIVCGNLHFSSVQSFLMDFFNDDRPVTKIYAIFMNKKEPDFRLRNLLEKNFMRVKYIKGTVMDQDDLERASAQNADACFILANHSCRSPKDEDAANIMRVISLKNFAPNLRILVQIIQNESKSFLRNIPSWNREKGDTIFCFTEIEQKVLSKCCLIPGYSTFVMNLISIRTEKQCKRFRKQGKLWLNAYIDGVGMELYSAPLSDTLEAMTYYELVLFCYNHLCLLLLAAEVKLSDGKTVFINPSSKSKVRKDTTCYFICQSYKEAKRASVYCQQCHGIDDKTIKRLDQIQCRCPRKEYVNEVAKSTIFMNRKQQFAFAVFAKVQKQIDFFRMPEKEFDKCLIKNPTEPLNFSNHIIFCIFSDDNSPSLGLKNFVLPLRSKKLKNKERRPIVITGNEKFLQKEWPSLSCFTDIHPVSFSTINKKTLSLLMVTKCRVCLILSARSNICEGDNQEPHLVDKDIILATLNVKWILKNSDEENKPFMVTKLFSESNIQFLDQDDTDERNCPVFLSETFACGNAFTTKMFDCLLTTTFFNPDVMKLIENLTAGEIFSIEDLSESSTSVKNRNVKCQIKVKSLMNKRFQPLFEDKDSSSYKDLFSYCFTTHQIILLGLYRLIERGSKTISSMKKVIITNPRPDLNITNQDFVLALLPVKKA